MGFLMAIPIVYCSWGPYGDVPPPSLRVKHVEDCRMFSSGMSAGVAEFMVSLRKRR